MRKNLRHYWMATSAVIGTATMLGGPAFAQSDSAGGGASLLDEVVVTAEHRTQSLQKAPLAITVRDGDDLLLQGRTSIDQILEDVPSVNWKINTGTVARNDTSATSISIRGIGSNGAVNGNILSLVPAVAQYVDGVVGGIGGSYDLDRVEVLRGPQGTLYGRSATAGVIDIHTRSPNVDAFSADVSGEVGSYDLRRVSGGVNVPVSDVFALRASGQFLSQDGYISREGGRIETTDARLKGLYTPNDNLTIALGAAYQKRDFNSGGAEVSVTPAGVNTNSVAPIGSGRDEQDQYWARVDYDLGPALLSYIPAYRSYTKSEVSYGFFGGNALVTGKNAIDNDTFHTQELRLSSKEDSRLQWQAGLYFYENELSGYTDQSVKGGSFPAGYQLHIGGTDKTTRNVGVFAEGTYPVLDTTRLTVGLRHDDTRIKTVQDDCSGALGAATNCVFLNDKRGWDQMTYKVRLEHDLAEDALLYASVSSAFLPGDVAVVTGAGGVLQASPYEQETLTSYELGAKARGWDNRLQANGAVFFYDYGGYQQPVQIGTFNGVALSAVKSSPARVKGAEIEILYRPTAADRLELTASYLDAYYVDKPAAFAAAVAQKRIPGITPVEATLAYSHTFELAGDHALTLKAEAAYSSAYDVGTLTPAQASSPVIRALLRQKAVTLGNVYATWRTSGPVTVSAYVRNIADTEYKNRVDASGTSTSLAGRLGAPRTYGLVVNASF